MKRVAVLVIMLCILSTSQVFAARVDGDYKVVFRGVEESLVDVNGMNVAPITHNGVMYLPIRPIMDLIGQHTEWSGSDRTIYVSDGGMIQDYSTVTTIPVSNVSVELDNTIKFVYHDQAQDVSCFIYRDTAYVPIQGIKGCSVGVDTDKKIISIKI